MADDEWKVVTKDDHEGYDESMELPTIMRSVSGIKSMFKRAVASVKPKEHESHIYIGKPDKPHRYEKNPCMIAYHARVWGLSLKDDWKEVATAHRMDTDMMLAPQWDTEGPKKPFNGLIDRGIAGLWAVFVFDDPVPLDAASPHSAAHQIVFQVCEAGNAVGLEQFLRAHPLLVQSQMHRIIDNQMRHDPGLSSPLMCATIHGHADCVKVLLEAGAIVDYQDEYGWTAVIIAVRYNRPECLALLVKAGADVDVRDEDTGWTPLMIAARHGHFHCMELLLAEMADLDLCTTKTRDVRFGKGSTEEVDAGAVGAALLLGAIVVAGAVASPAVGGSFARGGSNVVTRKENHGDLVVEGNSIVHGTTALMIAVQQNKLECVKLLLRYGADHSLVDGVGRRAFDFSWSFETREELRAITAKLPRLGPLLVPHGSRRKKGFRATMLLSHYADIHQDGFHAPCQGIGSSHWVVKGTWKPPGSHSAGSLVQEVAIKVYTDMAEFERERQLLSEVQSSFVVRLITSAKHNASYSIATEPCSLSLADIPTPVRSDLALSLLSQSAECVKHIHQEGAYVHGSIQPQHFLLASDGVAGRRVVLCSLKLMCREGEMQSTPVFNAFVSPERLVANQSPANPAADMYSLGAVWYYLLTGCYYCEDDTHMESVEPEPLRRLLVQLLSPDPSSRRTAVEAFDTVSALSGIGTAGMMGDVLATLESVRHDTKLTRVSVAEFMAHSE